MNIHVYEDKQETARQTAEAVAGHIRKNPGRLVCFAAGDTPLGMLQELILLQEKGLVDLNSVYYAGLDEWVGLNRDDQGSCAQVMQAHFYEPARIDPEKIHIFDGLGNPEEECRRMDAWIAAKGGIFLTVLGVGMNGHIGFNEPHTPDAEGCLVTKLDDVTVKVSEKYFGEPKAVEAGVTIGLRALMQAEMVYIMATGGHKADIVKRAFSDAPEPCVPASLMRTHPNLILVLDKAASDRLPQS